MKKKNVCNGLTFQDCELAILRMAVDEVEEKVGRRIVNSDDVKKIIEVVENFIKTENLICYGGTAINNILPSEEQFYNKDVEIPDYDFFSINALEDAKKLADIYFKQGFTDVEAKAGQHHGTYKVYVNYMPVADITHLDKEIYEALKKDSIHVAGILYASPNFLRMSMYLELSRPIGDVSRWEKVLKRLTLLNNNYPLTGENCNEVKFQRDMSSDKEEDIIYDVVSKTLINQGVVFFGGYAISLYGKYMPKKSQPVIKNIADFDVISNDPQTTSEIIKERLTENNIKNIKINKIEQIGEIIPEHYEIKVGKDTIAFIYKTIACHSYNVIKIDGQKVKIATIDTMLSFYLAFLYANKAYYNSFLDRTLCMSKFLFDVQQKNRLEQKGLLKRFSITCYGHQETIEEMRAEKAAKYKELKKTNNKKEMEEWFLNYQPDKTFKNGNDNNIKTKLNARSKTTKNPKMKTTKKTKTNQKNPKYKSNNLLLKLYGKRTKKNLY